MKDEDFDALLKQLSSGQFSSGSWEDVGSEFEALVRTLGEVLRTAWQSSDSDSVLGRLQELLSGVIRDWNDTVDGTPEAQQVRDQLVQLRESLAAAASQAGDQIRPELLRMLRQANAELRRRSGLDQPAP